MEYARKIQIYLLVLAIFCNFAIQSGLISPATSEIIMGTYINKGNNAFRDIVNSEYVDKTSLIPIINKTLNTECRYSCVSRSRRFGKSMAAKMLCAYYDKSCDSRELFMGLKVEKDKTFEKYLNRYNVIYLDVTSFTARPELGDKIVRTIQEKIIFELQKAFPDVEYYSNSDLMDTLSAIREATGEKFFFIIDEWDAICREFPDRRKIKGSPSGVAPTILDEYVMLLRRLFKTQDSDRVFAGAYLTGILPMMRSKSESGLNNFREYSMINPGRMANALGFTHDEVTELCRSFNMDIHEMEQWYDGYRIGEASHIFNPYSVMRAIENDRYKSYWTTTGAYDSVVTYIQMNFEGLKDDIIRMLVMIPRRNVSKPAIVIELKYNHSTDTAISQIKRKNYPEKLAEYTGHILLVGINYDKESKQHSCRIERIIHASN